MTDSAKQRRRFRGDSDRARLGSPLARFPLGKLPGYSLASLLRLLWLTILALVIFFGEQDLLRSGLVCRLAAEEAAVLLRLQGME